MRTFIAALAALILASLAGPVGTAEATDTTVDAPVVIRIAGPFDVESPDGEALQAELDAYAADRNVTITYEQFSDFNEAIDGPNPPDLVIVPQPGNLRDRVDDLVDLADFVKPKRLRRNYGNYLIDEVTVDGGVVGLPFRAMLKSLVWYRFDVFEANGYDVLETFDELIALSDSMVADGRTPWCAFMESGGATGWVGTDWIEDLLLGTEGPEVYDQWIDHDVLFVDPPIEQAFVRFQSVMDTAGYVLDRGFVLDVSFWENAAPLGASDCLMHKQASFFAAAIPDAGYDLDLFDTFEFPPVDVAYGDAAMGGGEYIAAITDSIEVRQLVKFMASPRFGRYAIAPADTGWILPNLRFDSARYGDGMIRTFAEQVQRALAAEQFRFDASDQMPPEVGADSFWAGIRNLLRFDRTLPEVLADIDASWPS